MNPNAIEKSGQIKVVKSSKCYLAFDESKLAEADMAIFSPQFWLSKNAISGTAQGRGTTYFVEHNQQQWVLKHYYRGGLIGKLIKDKYVFLGIEHTRAKREFELLVYMKAHGLPCPAPIAIGIRKYGLCYSADLITERIKNANDVVSILANRPLTENQWQAIGSTIKSFHQLGVYHDDLNCHNILLDQGDKVWLIDFDRGEQRKCNETWQRANLDRLLRSFRKEKTRLSEFYWQESDWQHLLAGYQST
ncbi:3-deoxy-D-manno-octulosonic acid kinase [Thalassotalea sp. LPB0316]|uniref:3-deoxy-D-manno-octulosonic acid kinase n=1 Tax=Thalassotalea sp. LPB0316 TaxID=2769490 RepID=UPI001865DD61|nr:3-deoxy-D-manno-octulosonic acid kinase [Thalassotalea sp. LPB0316]QOL26471.1 3-deoxy-D-manno-octulosonic acid kinase [Thalassotalea sp. LPB0316]